MSMIEAPRYVILRTDGSQSKRYLTEPAATRALARVRQIGSAVVWLDDNGKPKVWLGFWTAHGWDQVAPVPEGAR